MKLARHSDPDFSQKLAELAAPSSLFDPQIEECTRTILNQVQTRGDHALVEFTQRFDGAALKPDGFAVTHAELMSAALKATPSLRSAISGAQKNIAAFAKKSLRRSWHARN